MKKELTVTGKTIDEALANAEQQIGPDGEDLEYDIIEYPKKGLFGIGSSDAVIKVTYTLPDPNPALELVSSLVKALGLNTSVTAADGEEGEMKITVDGDGAGILIGHHGETLDALQYLANLAYMKGTGDKSRRRISLDIEGYREKRAETLRSLARRMSARVLKYKRPVTLEPMNPYERRIIHSEVQNIAGVTTHSIGIDTDRRIVITLDKTEKPAGD